VAYNRPTLKTIIDRVKGDIRDALEIPAVLRRSVEEAFAIAIGGAAHILHGHILYATKQLFPNLADGVYVERWGAIYNIQRKAATFTELTLSGTGVDGSTVAIGISISRSDGVTYTTTSEATVAAGVFTVDVICDTAGATGNLDDGEGLSFTSPVVGVDTDLVVDSTIVEGEDTESDESLRARIVARLRNPPQGGTVNDYISYATEVAGVTRAWVLPNWTAAGFLGEGGVGITFVEDGQDPIIPSAAKVQEVQDNVNIRKPVTADALVFAPIANVINLTINLKPNTPSVRDAVTAELEDLFLREGQVAGAVDPDRIAEAVTYGGGLSLSKINEAISIAAGEEDHILVSPTVDVVSADGELITLGTITFGTLA
jgi:uncharacterized phage protein gp47/JayE